MDTRDAIKAMSDAVRLDFQRRYGESSNGYAYNAGYLESMLIRAVDMMPKKTQKEFLELVQHSTPKV